MPAQATEHQRDLMREFHLRHAGNEALVCAAYAQAESKGQAFRKRGDFRMPPEDYARALWRDGMAKGWLTAR